jgi:hypothetical protein
MRDLVDYVFLKINKEDAKDLIIYLFKSKHGHTVIRAIIKFNINILTKAFIELLFASIDQNPAIFDNKYGQIVLKTVESTSFFV